MVARLRVLFFLLTIVIVGTVGYFLSYYAKGYRFDPVTFSFAPNGILVIKSNPDGAQVFINNGEFKAVTNSTLNLPPGTYDVSVRKEGYMSWNKRLTITKEVVTDADAHLYRMVPSLSAVTFSGVITPLPSPDYNKIAYIVPPGTNGESTQLSGLWVMELINLPLGFSRDPKRITDGDLTGAFISWSPDSRQILLRTTLGSYLLDSGTFTPQASRINVLAQQEKITADWQILEEKRTTAKSQTLPDPLGDILNRKVEAYVYSPDETKILYTASQSASIPDDILPPLPGSSTQKQERQIQPGHTYVYDLKEDRNFQVDEDYSNLTIEPWKESEKPRRMFWFPSSRHIVLAEAEKITILDMDGTNRQTVYSGSYFSPNVLPAGSTDKLLILTNLGADSTPPNLYTLSLK